MRRVLSRHRQKGLADEVGEGDGGAGAGSATGLKATGDGDGAELLQALHHAFRTGVTAVAGVADGAGVAAEVVVVGFDAADFVVVDVAAVAAAAGAYSKRGDDVDADADVDETANVEAVHDAAPEAASAAAYASARVGDAAADEATHKRSGAHAHA